MDKDRLSAPIPDLAKLESSMGWDFLLLMVSGWCRVRPSGHKPVP